MKRSFKRTTLIFATLALTQMTLKASVSYLNRLCEKKIQKYWRIDPRLTKKQRKKLIEHKNSSFLDFSDSRPTQQVANEFVMYNLAEKIKITNWWEDSRLTEKQKKELADIEKSLENDPLGLFHDSYPFSIKKTAQIFIAIDKEKRRLELEKKLQLLKPSLTTKGRNSFPPNMSPWPSYKQKKLKKKKASTQTESQSFFKKIFSYFWVQK